MKIINGERQSGRTTMLIIASAVTGKAIVVQNEQQARLIEQEAKRMELEIPTVMSFNRIAAIREKGCRLFTDAEEAGFLVDNAEQIIEQLLEAQLGGKVSAITICAPNVLKAKHFGEDPRREDHEEAEHNC